MISMNTTDVIDFDSPEFQAAKSDLELKLSNIFAERKMELSPEKISAIAWDVIHESHHITIMFPPDVPKGKRGPKPNPATPMAGWAAADICERHELGASGAWDNADTGERSVAADIYKLIFAHTKAHIDPEYRGRHQDARHGLEKGQGVTVTRYK